MRYLAETALLDDRVEQRVLIDIAANGTIVSVEPQSTKQAEHLRGLVVPGMPNLHSHAFQRAMAGLAERAGPEGDNFWHWRDVMYRFLAVLGPRMYRRSRRSSTSNACCTATLRSPSSTICTTHRMDRVMPIRRNSRVESWPRHTAPASASPCCRC